MNGVDGIIYIPITYIILSEYPYFYHFNEICKNIFIQMKKETDEMPIDIILYNIIKYCPSPINKNINFSFGAQININMNEKMTINNITKILNSLPNKREEINGIPSMFFNQLSGYPFLDINLSFIFNLIPPEIICEVFIFSFLEQDIIFYSERPEILNMIIYIFSNLNYPFNDSIYYWHLLSVSKENFMSGTSTFVGKTCSTLIGILGQYDPDLLTTKKITEHFVLDIDNKNFFFLFQEETEEVKEIMDLFMYIKSCAVQEEETPAPTPRPRCTAYEQPQASTAPQRGFSGPTSTSKAETPRLPSASPTTWELKDARGHPALCGCLSAVSASAQRRPARLRRHSRPNAALRRAQRIR